MLQYFCPLFVQFTKTKKMAWLKSRSKVQQKSPEEENPYTF